VSLVGFSFELGDFEHAWGESKAFVEDERSCHVERTFPVIFPFFGDENRDVDVASGHVFLASVGPVDDYPVEPVAKLPPDVGEEAFDVPSRCDARLEWGFSAPLLIYSRANDPGQVGLARERRSPTRFVSLFPTAGERPAMSRNRSDIPPETLGVSLEPEGVEVTYTDGRCVFYHGVPTKVEASVTSAPGKDVHVLVTDPTETEGVMVYVNDLKTHDDILESTGVGRVMLEDGETASLFPGVDASSAGYRVEVDADPETARGRVFVFVEDEMGERSYEIVAEEDAAVADEGEESRAEVE
jgi:hypothetical protein